MFTKSWAAANKMKLAITTENKTLARTSSADQKKFWTKTTPRLLQSADHALTHLGNSSILLASRLMLTGKETFSGKAYNELCHSLYVQTSIRLLPQKVP